MNPKDMWNPNGTPANGVTLNPDFQEFKTVNGEKVYTTSDDSIRTQQEPYTHDGKTYYREYEYNVIPWDIKKIKETYKPAAQAEADAMLDVSDPKDAIAFWNNNLKGKYTKDMEDYDGVMPYQNMNAEGDKNLIYDMKEGSPTYGQINPKFKENFHKAYEQYYYDNTLKPFVDQDIQNPNVNAKATDKCTDQNGNPAICHTESSSITFKYKPGTNFGGTS